LFFFNKVGHAVFCIHRLQLTEQSCHIFPIMQFPSVVNVMYTPTGSLTCYLYPTFLSFSSTSSVYLMQRYHLDTLTQNRT
jgi:hypothetical protein